MSPRLKAIMMIEEFWSINPRFTLGTGNADYSDAKKYAIICLSEIVAVGMREFSGTSWEDSYAGEFWNEVKKEIDNYGI